MSRMTLLSHIDDPQRVLWREEPRYRRRPGEAAEEAVRLLLIAAQRLQQRLQLGRHLEHGELAGEIVDRQGLFVALPLVAGERFLQRLALGKAGVDRVRQQLRVAE